MKKTLLLWALMFALLSSKAQQLPFQHLIDDLNVNFYTVCKAAEAHFDTINKDVKGSGYKIYLRWKNDNETRYFPSGNRNLVSPSFVNEQFEQFQKVNKIQNRSMFNGKWRDLGPYTIDSITGHYAAGLGRIECMYVSPKNANILYLGSRSGGFWKTTDGGSTWKGSTSYLPASGVNIIAVSPTNSDSILINLQNSTNNYSHGIYRSTDGGNTWFATKFIKANVGYGGLGDNFVIHKIHYHPRIPNLVFVGTNRGLYRSTDNLATWTRLMTSTEPTEIAFHPTNDSVVYMYDGYYWSSNQDQIYVSRNFGTSFSLAGTLTGNASNRSIEFSVSSLCTKCLWVASSKGVWKSGDEGKTFTFLSAPPFGCGGFAVNDKDTSKMCHGYVDLANSSDGGRSFKQATWWSLGNTNGAGSGNQVSYKTSTNYIHADVDDLDCINGVFYTCTDGFLCKSSDNGKTWTKLSSGVGTRENYKLGTSQSNHYRTLCGSQDNGTSLRNKNGWVEIYGADGMEQIIHPLNENYMIGSFQYGGRILSKDGGKSQSTYKPNGGKDAQWEAPMAYDPLNPFTVYDFKDTVFKSTDFGKTFVKLGGPVTFTGNIMQAEIAQNNTNIIAISQNEKLELSTDGGVTFKNIKGSLPTLGINEMAFDPKNDSTLVVVYGNYENNGNKIYITKNLGSTWTNITYNMGNMPIRSVVIDHSPAKNIYVGAEIGVYYKSMASNTWSLYNSNLPNTSVEELEINWGSNTLKAVTWGRGLWEYNLVNRENYPAILTTNITNPPTENSPKTSIDQYVTSTIHYNGTPKKVFVRWSKNGTKLDSSIAMSNISDSTWRADKAFPNQTSGTKIYFKVYAVGNSADTSETYRFMYEVKPYNYCSATGSSTNGNLYISDFSIGTTKNTSTNNKYSNYNTPVFTLYQDTTYTVTANANTGWTENDFGAFIDYNKDADFSADEYILNKSNQGSKATNSFKVPKIKKYGDTTKMRVRLSYWDGEPNPCGTDQLGEVEDYKVVLKYIPKLTYTFNNTTVCQNDSAVFNFTGDNADSISWSLTNGSTAIKSNKKTDKIKLSTAGNYNLSISAYFTKDKFTVSKTNLITVNPVYNISNKASVCYGSSYQYADGTIHSNLKANETYTSKLKTAKNCDSIVQTSVTVYPLNNTDNKAAVCSGQNFIYADGFEEKNITSPTSHISVFKAFNGCDSTINTSVAVKQLSSYTDKKTSCGPLTWIDGKVYSTTNNSAIFKTINAAGCDSIITLDFVMNGIIATVNKSGLLLTANPSGKDYQWLNCTSNTPISGETNQTFTPTINGDYSVIVTSNGCNDTSECISISGVNTDNFISNKIVVSPNPNNGNFDIKCKTLTGKVELTLYNNLGQIVHTQTGNATELIKIKATNIAAGNYYLFVRQNQTLLIQKVLVE